MTKVLTKQQADEAAHRDMCVDDLNENALTTEDKDGMKNRTEDKILILKTKIGGCEKDWVCLKIPCFSHFSHFLHHGPTCHGPPTIWDVRT